MPWTVSNPPAVAKNWTDAEQAKCVSAANATLASGGSDSDAIHACIAAAGKSKHVREALYLEILPGVLEIQRDALRLRMLREADAEKVQPTGQPSDTVRTDREWTNGEQRRLGNTWDKVMAGTGAEGILNAEAERE